MTVVRIDISRFLLSAALGILASVPGLSHAATSRCRVLPTSTHVISAANPESGLEIDGTTGTVVYTEAAIPRNHWPKYVVRFSIDRCSGGITKGTVTIYFKRWSIEADGSPKCSSVGKKSRSDVWKMGGNQLVIGYKDGNPSDATLMLDEYAGCSPNTGSIPDLRVP